MCSTRATASAELTYRARRYYMRKALALEQSRPGLWPEAAVARTEFHLSQILIEQGEDLGEAEMLTSHARDVLARLLPLVEPLGEVDVEDELALFDHLQPVFDGRFTGTSLLKYVAKKAEGLSTSEATQADQHPVTAAE